MRGLLTTTIYSLPGHNNKELPVLDLPGHLSVQYIGVNKSGKAKESYKNLKNFYGQRK
jgi:hypothetical protein